MLFYRPCPGCQFSNESCKIPQRYQFCEPQLLPALAQVNKIIFKVGKCKRYSGRTAVVNGMLEVSFSKFSANDVRSRPIFPAAGLLANFTTWNIAEKPKTKQKLARQNLGPNSMQLNLSNTLFLRCSSLSLYTPILHIPLQESVFSPCSHIPW